jgi:hypothetical protein
MTQSRQDASCAPFAPAAATRDKRPKETFALSCGFPRRRFVVEATETG